MRETVGIKEEMEWGRGEGGGRTGKMDRAERRQGSTGPPGASGGTSRLLAHFLLMPTPRHRPS